MATEVALGGAGELFVGEDKVLYLEVLDNDPAKNGVPVDIAAWSIVFDIREKDNATVILLKKDAVVEGVFASVRVNNTQRAVVTLTSDEMDQFKGSNLSSGAKTYRHSWKRTDTAKETVLCRGDFAPEKATAD
jgi:hypothetical protein